MAGKAELHEHRRERLYRVNRLHGKGSGAIKRETLAVGGRGCIVHCVAQPKAILIQPTGEHEQSMLDAEIDLIEQRCGDGFLLVSFPVADWNRELSPWDAPPVFGKEGFGHGAEGTLSFIERELLPAILQRYGLPEAIPVILGGYSLAGLFSLWSAFQTDRFSAVASASPSVWFPAWIEYAQREVIRAQRVYLSLGDREGKTKNPVMAQVGECIRTLEQLLREKGVDCVLEWNEGNHFRDAEKRTAAAFVWCLESVQILEKGGIRHE